MKLGIIGCLAGSAAALFFSGCAADPYATTTTYGTGYYSSYDTAPAFVERRTVLVDNTPRVVPIYRTGDTFFYTYGGRRFTYDYPGFRRTAGARIVTRPAYSSARFRDWERRDWDRRDWDRRDIDTRVIRTTDDERRIRRSAYRRSDLDSRMEVDTRRLDRDFEPINEDAGMRRWNQSTRMTERRVRISD